MPRPRSPEEVRRLKEQGLFDVGTTYISTHGGGRPPKHKFWDGYVPPEDQE